MARGISILMVGLVLFAATLAALAWRSEQTAGLGPREASGAAAGPTRTLAVVANAVGGTVTLIDLTDFTVVSEFTVIPDGARVWPLRDPLQSIAQPIVEGRGGLNYAQDTDLSRDGTVLYVSRGFLADVAAFDIASGALLWRTSIAGVRADHMAISPDGTRLYVSATILGGDVVEALNAADGRRIGRFSTGRWPHDVHVSQDGARIYAASLGDMSISETERGAEPDAYLVNRVSAESLEEDARWMFEAGVRPFAVTADETVLFAQLSNTHAVIKHDLRTDTQLARVDLPVDEGVGEADWDFEAPHHGLALSPDEERLCIAGRASDYAAILSAETLEPIAITPVGDAPSWAAITPDGALCVIANTRSDDVSIVSMEDGRELARIPAGRGAKHVTIGEVPAAALD